MTVQCIICYVPRQGAARTPFCRCCHPACELERIFDYNAHQPAYAGTLVVPAMGAAARIHWANRARR